MLTITVQFIFVAKEEKYNIILLAQQLFDFLRFILIKFIKMISHHGIKNEFE